MKELLITAIVITLSTILHAQTPVTQVEGFLEVYHPEDTTSLYIGKGSGQVVDLSFERSNTFVGHSAGRNNTIGRSNSFYGRDAGLSNTTGGSNSFYGRDAGRNNTTAFSNSFYGRGAGLSNTTGGSNSFYGRSAGFSNTMGGSNSFYGLSAGFRNTTGFSNSFYGRDAGWRNTTGASNSFYGRRAGQNLTTQSQMIVIGANAGPANPAATDSMQLYIDVEETDGPLIFGDFDNDILLTNGELHLGPNTIPEGNGGDEGVIRSPQPNGSDIFMIANDAIVMQIGEVNSESGAFEIKNGGNDELLLGIDESGDLRIKGSYNMISDRHAKTDFQTIDSDDILSKIAELPITKWNYKNSTDQHIGPMAQDFYAAFGLGQGETTIATVDADGVALAAIQALLQKSDELGKANNALKIKNQELEKRIAKIEGLLLLEK